LWQKLKDMRKIVYGGILFFVATQTIFGQITTTKVAEKQEIIDNAPYDSLENFLGSNVYQYIGQELFLLPKAESLRKYGYEGFYIDFTKAKHEKGALYKCCDSYNSKYDALQGKYFLVKAVHKHPKAKENERIYGKKFYLELIEKESGDKLFYEYSSEYKHSFPFVVVGYFIKQKEQFIGKEFVIRGKNWQSITEPMTDMNTGKPVELIKGSTWKCIDLTIEEKYFSLALVIENDKGERIPLSLSQVDNTRFVFKADDVKLYIKKFGKDKWEDILNGVVVVGFTEEMVLLAWGKPDKINRSSHGDQWVYSDQYLYFENGIMKSFN
jgi:hypothetical protein